VGGICLSEPAFRKLQQEIALSPRGGNLIEPGLTDPGSTSSASFLSAPFPSPLECFVKLPFARTGSLKSTSAISRYCAGPISATTKSVPTPPCTPPWQKGNLQPPISRPTPSPPTAVQKLCRTRNGIITTASSATGFPARSAGTNFHLARAFDAKESKRSSSLLRTRNIAYLAIRANDGIQRDHAVDVGTNQFQRIAGV